MTTLREAAQQALEALEKYRHMMFVEAGCRLDDGDAAIDALRAALEQPKRHVSYVCPQCHWSLEQPVQEPVAWMHRHIEGNIITHRPADLDRRPDRWTPLYKNPTPCETCQALARTVMMDQMGAA